MVQRLVDASLVRTRLGAASVLTAAILGSAWGATVHMGGEGTAGATSPEGVTPLESTTQAAVSVPRVRVTAPTATGTDGAEPATEPVVVLNPVPPAETRTRTVVVTVTMRPSAPAPSPTTTAATSAPPTKTSAPPTTSAPSPSETATKPGGKAVDGEPGSAAAGGRGGGSNGGVGG